MPDTTIARNLERLGLTLPGAPAPVASYAPARRSGDLVHISGQIPLVDGALLATGRVPDEVDEPTAARCARQCTLNGLACLEAEIGDLERIDRVVRVGVFVAATPGFTAHPRPSRTPVRTCSLRSRPSIGVHARAAVGVASLPLGAPVEIEFAFRISRRLIGRVIRRTPCL